MKKLLCLLIAAVMIAAAIPTFSVSALSTNGKLTVVANGEILGEIEVGNEFIYKVAVDTGGLSPQMGMGELRCNAKYVQVVEYGEKRDDGSVNMDAYSFPKRIRNSALVTNYAAADDKIVYNFSKGSTGIGAFTAEDHYFKVRLKAVSAGLIDLRHYLTSLSLVKKVGQSYQMVRIIYNDEGNTALDPVPYTVCTIEPATAFIGDANGDYALNIMDATFIQRATAGVESTYNAKNADVNADGEVDLRDALAIVRHEAGVETDTAIGEWIFESEQAELS